MKVFFFNQVRGLSEGNDCQQELQNCTESRSG